MMLRILKEGEGYFTGEIRVASQESCFQHRVWELWKHPQDIPPEAPGKTKATWWVSESSCLQVKSSEA
jgi:hypothetical protein